MKAALLAVLVVAAGWVGLAQQPDPIPLLHGLASFVVPGLGQYLNGEYNKALLHFAVDVGIVVGGSYIALGLAPYPGWNLVAWAIGVAHTAWALYSGWDAYTVALRQRGLSWELQPQRMGFAFQF